MKYLHSFYVRSPDWKMFANFCLLYRTLQYGIAQNFHNVEARLHYK